MLPQAEKKKVTKSISELGRRVTAADVSTKTGLPVLVVSQSLNQIASETGGHIHVSAAGDVVYSFSPGFSNTYLTQGLKRVLEKTGEKLFKLAYFMLKISFGVMLILSFFIIVLTFFVLFFADRGQNNKRPNKKKLSAEHRFDFLNYLVMQDFFYYLTNPNPPVKYDYRHPTVRKRNKPNFLLDCFSFLFGDGDPNEGLEEKRWQLIAKVIKQNNNVITAEQLAPYTGADPKNEDAVLPVLVRFDGRPEVTESGNIIYRFPTLAVTGADAAEFSDRDEETPPYLKEFPLKFTEIDQSALKPVYFIAGLNFAGSWFLWMLLHASKSASIQILFTSLVVYGSLFLLVPFARFLSLNFFNQRIKDRNLKRRLAAEALLAPSPELRKKITESREYRMKDMLISEGTIVYTTTKDSLDQGEEDELASRFKVGEQIDARPEETFDASPHKQD